MGPSFIAAAAANAHPRYLAALIAARPENTIYSRAFTAWWDAPGRALRSCVEAATAFRGEVVGETPSLEATRTPVTRFAPEVADRETTGAMEAMPL